MVDKSNTDQVFDNSGFGESHLVTKSRILPFFQNSPSSSAHSPASKKAHDIVNAIPLQLDVRYAFLDPSLPTNVIEVEIWKKNDATITAPRF